MLNLMWIFIRKLITILLDNDKLTLKMRYARTNVVKFSFFHRVVGTWNSRPLFIREATSVNSFKALVKRFFMDQHNL